MKRICTLVLMLMGCHSIAYAAPKKYALVIADPTASGNHAIDPLPGKEYIKSLRDLLLTFNSATLLYDGSLDHQPLTTPIPLTQLPTLANAKREITNLVEKINTGIIQSGDEIFIFLDLHGEENADGEAVKLPNSSTHCDWIDGECFDVDQLKAITSLAVTKNIHIAIFDGACFSGASQALSNSNSCIVSTSQWYEPGAADFPMKLIENVRPGMNLEEVYLSTRFSYKFAFPTISGSAGVMTNLLLQDLLIARLAIADDKNSTDFFKDTKALNPYLPLSSELANMLSNCVSNGKLQDTESCMRLLFNVILSGSENMKDSDVETLWNGIIDDYTHAQDPSAQWVLPKSFRSQERTFNPKNLPVFERPVYDKLYQFVKKKQPSNPCSNFYF